MLQRAQGGEFLCQYRQLRDTGVLIHRTFCVAEYFQNGSVGRKDTDGGRVIRRIKIPRGFFAARFICLILMA